MDLYRVPYSNYENINTEIVRENSGRLLAQYDTVEADFVAGVLIRDIPCDRLFDGVKDPVSSTSGEIYAGLWTKLYTTITNRA